MKVGYQAPFAGHVKAPKGENEGMITGNWRVVRPVYDPDKCTMCMMCYIYCPDACIQPTADKTTLQFNLKYCKGCGLCWHECPTGAISSAPELDFKE